MKWIFDYFICFFMNFGVIVGFIVEAKEFVVLGFCCEVEGVRIFVLICLKFIIFFCKFGIIFFVGYREWERK